MKTTGELCWVSPRARLGAQVRLGYFVVVRDNVAIGDRCQIGDHAVLGVTPTVARASTLAKVQTTPEEDGPRHERADEEWLRLGDDCVVGPGAVVYVDSRIGEGTFIADGVGARIGAVAVILPGVDT